jgi:predicted metal-binding protein
MASKRQLTIRRRSRPPIVSFIPKALKFGARTAKVVRASSVATAPWVRLKCQFGCGGYSSSLCCPPHTPTPDEMRKVLDSYRRSILLEVKLQESKKIAVQLERELFLAGYYRALGLGAGPCRLCRECAFGKGCRHSYQARPSMEACGIDVYQTARVNGFSIEVVRSRRDPQHYFGLVLVE